MSAQPAEARRPISAEIAQHLPMLRRHARALTGAQDRGDAHVAVTLEALIEDATPVREASDIRTGLYRTFHDLWRSAMPESAAPEGAAAEDPREAAAQGRLARLTGPSRQALLLVHMEGFSLPQAAEILRMDRAEAERLLADAVGELDRQTRARALVIEDEPIIALDIERILTGMGHEVVATADTHARAVETAERETPDLILADIRLADGSSGLDAVREILESASVPVIFVTAYPERLLTGERPEPTYLITKPFETDTLRAAVSQALFFSERAGV
jgi:CheY-like chemotaxis protein